MEGFKGLTGLSVGFIFHVAMVFIVLNPPFVVKGHPFCGRENGGESMGRFPFATKNTFVSGFLWKHYMMCASL